MADKFPHQLLGAFLMFLVFQPFVAKSRPVTLELAQNQEQDQRSSGSLDDIGLFHFDFNDILSGGRWSESDFPLTYGFTSKSAIPVGISHQELDTTIDAAFQEWQSVIPEFAFQRIYPGGNAQIKIEFTLVSGYNYGQAFYPPDGRLYLDIYHTTWSIKSYHDKNEFDLISGALHEIGHTLGLNHSSNPDAVMFPTLQAGTLKNKLSQEDISRIKNLYSSSQAQAQAQPHLELPKSI